jgi:hypothetical protein
MFTVSVYQFQFSSTAYDEQCLKLNEKPNEEERLRLFKTKSDKIYKKFYEPRLKWFAQQRDFMRHLRQNELIYNEIIKNIKNEANESSNVLLTDSLPIISTQEFMNNIVTQSTPNARLAGESIETTLNEF